jgi:hypothetical protein
VREPANDYSANQYERPNQPWVCGLADSGRSCPAGPTARGRCPAMAECAPMRNGDRWECNRSQLRGGPCDDGPTPEGRCGRMLKCHPTRSLRTLRGQFVRACALLVAGVAIISLSANWRDRVIAPGPLARQHAQLMERTGGAPNCAACHATIEQNVAGWMSSLVVARGDRPSQSQLCMICHAKTISTELALSAHNVPAELLRRVTEGEVRLIQKGIQKGGIQKGSELFSRNDNGEPHRIAITRSDPFLVACSACHREHHGAQINLTAIDNAACQSCHRQRIKSFASDHPDFGIWPYEQRTRIAFNHASHRDKHFTDKKTSFDCSSCHAEDATGKVQLTASFETTCAACHDEKITTSVARGVPMLALPAMDTTALRSAGFEVGAWPKGATGDFDGRLPPMMKLLLAADPAAVQAMMKLGPDFDFQDVNPKDRQQLEACAAIASAIKTLSAEMAESADTTIRTRLQSVLGRIISDAQIGALAAGLSADTLQSAMNSWFADMKAGKEASKAVPVADTNKAVAIQNDKRRPITYAPFGKWFYDEPSLSIRYKPGAHADPVLATWLSVLAEAADLNQRPVAAAMFKELSKANAPGLCSSCHSVERTAENKLAINWRTHDRTAEPRGFTKFSHGPHLLLSQLADCTHCHAIDGAASAATAYTDSNPARFVSDFAPISKRQCVECHTAKAAGDACQQCHNYHVEAVSQSRIKEEALQSAIREKFIRRGGQSEIR